MRRIGAGTGFHAFLTWTQAGFGLAGAVIATTLKADAASWRQTSPGLSNLLLFLQQNAFWLIPALTFLTGLAQWAKKLVGPPWVWDTVHLFMDKLAQQAFSDVAEDPKHHHRATLFKHKRFHLCLRQWPWAGWLVAVERSGHTTRKTVTIFQAPDDADQVEGVAGLTWACRGIVHVTELPDLVGSPSEESLATYALKTGVTAESLKKKKWSARAFCGIPVEVKGRLWGVVVLDSRNKDALKSKRKVQETYDLVGGFLGKVLERA
jgi:hypothetical protein